MKRLVRTLAAVPLAAALCLATFLPSSCASTPNAELARQWYELGNTWFDKGDWKKAGEAYSKAITLDPALAAANYNMARALAEGGDFDGALKTLEILKKEDPGNVRVLATRAWVLYKKGDSAAAVAAYDEVLALDAYAPDAVFNSALLRHAAGQDAEALAGLAKYLAYKPDDDQAILLEARVQEAMGRSGEAIADYERLRDMGKLAAPGQLRLGALYEAARRYSEALDAYAAAVKDQPKLVAALFAIARLKLTAAEDAEGGLDALRKAIDAGFKDAKAAQDLLDSPVLAGREAVAKLLADKGIVK